MLNLWRLLFLREISTWLLETRLCELLVSRYNAQRHAVSSLNRAAILAGFVALRKSYCVHEWSALTRIAHIKRRRDGRDGLIVRRFYYSPAFTRAHILLKVSPSTHLSLSKSSLSLWYCVLRRGCTSRFEEHRNKRHADISWKQTISRLRRITRFLKCLDETFSLKVRWHEY